MNEQESVKRVPVPTLRRLPVYLRCLQEFERRGREWVSCAHLAERLGFEQTQIRKDLACAGATGRPKIGYRTAVLSQQLEAFLGWDNVSDTFLAGVGNIGRALLGYTGFAQHGLRIVAAFDVHPGVVGASVNEVPVLPVHKLPELADRMHVQIGILCVPPGAAQQVADMMVLGGIRAIWNFAPVLLAVPESVTVENEDLAAGLAVLSQRLASGAAANERTRS